MAEKYQRQGLDEVNSVYVIYLLLASTPVIPAPYVICNAVSSERCEITINT
jgi:hypothetical protein